MTKKLRKGDRVGESILAAERAGLGPLAIGSGAHASAGDLSKITGEASYPGADASVLLQTAFVPIPKAQR